MLSPEDPRLAARASGDLAPEESARLDAELAEAPEARERLAELIAMQDELKAAFAAEARAEERLAREGAEGRGEVGGEGRGFWDWVREVPCLAWGNVLAACIAIMFLGAITIPTVGRVRETAHRSVASSNLRQIGQASMIVASDNGDVLPGAMAKDIYDYARIAAKDGGLNDATIWVVSADPASAETAHRLSTVLTKDKQGLDPAFAETRLSWAVALHPELTMKLPATTPIAWTRGLQPDGTWVAHSPYGTDGGHVMFLGGNVAWYRNTKDEFVRADGTKTSNVLEALPAGARIAEYRPTAEEAAAWARAHRVHAVKREVMPYVWPGVWGAALVVLWVQGARRRWSYFWLQLFLLLSALVAVVIPTVC